MPNLQSVVIVMLKVVLANVAAIGVQPNANGPNAVGGGFQGGGQSGLPKIRSNVNMSQQASAYPAQNEQPVEEESLPTIEELDAIRQREITGKAISGSILLLLKWFKLSRTVKPSPISCPLTTR